MKKQIKRLSPHQNGKVVGLVAALAALIFISPMYLAMSLGAAPRDLNWFSIGMTSTIYLFAPVVYLFVGYAFAAIVCVFYNFISRFVGGFEYEVEEISG